MKRIIGITSAAWLVALALSAGARAAETKGAAASKSTSAAKHSTSTTSKTDLAKSGAAKAEKAREESYVVQVVDLNEFVTLGEKATPASVTTGANDREPQYGLLMGGVLYVPLMKDMGSPVKALSGHLGKSITVTALKETRSGEHFLILSSVRESTPEHKS
jgi:hypothetical protein